MQCNQSFCGTGLPNCGQLTNYSQIPNCSQFPYYCQYPNYTQAPNCGHLSPYNPALQCNGASYPEIIGEGEVISLTLPDGSMKLYFQPTIKWCAPFVQNPNDVRYNNTAWFVRNISSLNSVNTIGNAVPQPVFSQNQSPYVGPPVPRPCFSCNSNIALPIQTVPPCQLKFHSDGWTSTTDLEYFYPRVRKSDVVSKSCAGVQVSSPTATGETNKSCHCYVVCPKPCDCHKTCYKEMKADAISSSHGDTKSPNPFSEYHSKTREKDVDNSQSYWSIDEANLKRKSSHNIKTKKITCSSHLQKGIIIACSCVEDTKSKDIIDKKTKKEKVKEKTKKKKQSQESLCRCCSSTSASTSSLTCSEKKKVKLEKNEKNNRKRKRDSKSPSQSKSKDNQSETGTDMKTEEPKKKKIKLEKNEKKERKIKVDCKCSSQSASEDNQSKIETELPMKKKVLNFSRSRIKHEKKSNKIDDRLVSLCTCCSTATRNSRTSNKEKHKPNQEKKTKKKAKGPRIDVCECSSHPQKGIDSASSQSGTSVEDTKSKNRITKMTKKEKVKKVKRKKKEQNQEGSCSCCSCSSTTASTSSLISSEKKKIMLKKKDKRERKSKRDRKSSSQSESKNTQSESGTDNTTKEPNKKKIKLDNKMKKESNNKKNYCKCFPQSDSKDTQGDTGTYIKTKEPKGKKVKLENKKKKESNNKKDCKCCSQSASIDTQSDTGTEVPKKKRLPEFSRSRTKDEKKSNESDVANSADIEEKTKHKKKLKKDTNEKKKKQDISIDDSLVSLCSCCSTATRIIGRTSNEKKVKKDKIKHNHENTSAGSNKPERKIKDTKTTHVHECHTCLELEESRYCMCPKASNSSLVKKAVKEKVCDRVMQLDGETDNFSRQVATHMDQGTNYTYGTACGSQTTCEKPIIENPMLKCFPEINNIVKFPA